MKKKGLLLTILVVMAFFYTYTSVYADTATYKTKYGTYSYMDDPNNSDGIKLTRYNEKRRRTAIYLPSEIDGRKVTSIGAGIFGIEDEVDVYVKKLVIPETVIRLEDGCFTGVDTMTSVVIPDSVEYIGKRAFSDTILKSVKLPENLKVLRKYAFSGCSYLEKISLPDNLTTIESGAVSYCHNLKKLSIPANVKKIEQGAFNGLTGLETIRVSSKNKKYDSRESCNAIIDTKESELIYACNNTVVPNSVKVIGSYAFSYCDKFETVELPEGVITIKSSAFEYNHKIKKLIIPSTVNKIENYILPFSNETEIVLKTTKLNSKTLGKRAFELSTMKNKANIKFCHIVIKVPQSKLSYYKKLIKKQSGANFFKGINPFEVVGM